MMVYFVTIHRLSQDINFRAIALVQKLVHLLKIGTFNKTPLDKLEVIQN
ncbi:MAG: hypothetical protein QNJ41_13925 [Xenococcaceae cyanobacterium MO_188.B32]|nr:hypothetical protein [Xenococcaceae cyanobacterium MO_188.B32]